MKIIQSTCSLHGRVPGRRSGGASKGVEGVKLAWGGFPPPPPRDGNPPLGRVRALTNHGGVYSKRTPLTYPRGATYTCVAFFPFYFRESVGVILIFLNKYDRVLKMLCEMVRWCVSIECWLNCDVFYFLDVICYVNAWLCISIL